MCDRLEVILFLFIFIRQMMRAGRPKQSIHFNISWNEFSYESCPSVLSVIQTIQGRERKAQNICWQNTFDVTSERRFVLLPTINKFEKAFYVPVYLFARKLVFDEALNIFLRITLDADDDDIKAPATEAASLLNRNFESCFRFRPE